jgi:hypothetical protein
VAEIFFGCRLLFTLQVQGLERQLRNPQASRLRVNLLGSEALRSRLTTVLRLVDVTHLG